MGGPKKQDTQLQEDAARQQIQLGQRQADQAQGQIDTQKAYQAPYAKFLQGIIGGDQGSKIASAQVPLTQIANSAQQAKESILDNTPAGAGRDFALAGLQRDKAAQSSGFLNTAYLNAFPTLAGLGNTSASIGLQQLGAGERGLEGGSSSINQVNQTAANQKASTLGLIGGLAGTAGKVATGFSQPSVGGDGFNPTYAANPLGNGQFGAGPSLPPVPSFLVGTSLSPGS